MESKTSMERLLTIEKEIDTLLNEGNSGLSFNNAAYDVLGFATSVAAFFFPESHVLYKALSFSLNGWVKTHLLPMMGHWKSNREIRSISTEVTSKLKKWQEILETTSKDRIERVNLSNKLLSLLEAKKRDDNLQQQIKEIVNELILMTNNVVIRELTDIVSRVEKLKVQDLDLLQANAREIETILDKVKRKEFSTENPLYFELDEDDELIKNHPYRKIFAFSDVNKDYSNDVKELIHEVEMIKQKTRSSIEYQTDQLRVFLEEAAKPVVFSFPEKTRSGENAKRDDNKEKDKNRDMDAALR